MLAVVLAGDCQGTLLYSIAVLRVLHRIRHPAMRDGRRRIRIGHTDFMDESWLKFRDDLSNALRAFVRGDAGPYKALWSHSADTSIMVPLAATTGDGTTSPNGWIGLPPSTATASTTASRSSPTLREQTLPT